MNNSNRRLKRKKAKKDNFPNKGIKINSFESASIVCQKVAHINRNLITDLKTWPNSIIAGYDEGKSVLIQYKNTSNENLSDQAEKDLNELSSFFSPMIGKTGETFTILNADYDDSLTKPTKAIEGNYKFISYISEGLIAAEKTTALDSNMSFKKMEGRHFKRPPQFQKEKAKESKKKISSIINHLEQPNFNDYNFIVGDMIELEGTLYNDERYTIIDIIHHNDGSQELRINPQIKQNENRIGKLTKLNHYRKKQEVNLDQSSARETGMRNSNVSKSIEELAGQRFPDYQYPQNNTRTSANESFNDRSLMEEMAFRTGMGGSNNY